MSFEASCLKTKVISGHRIKSEGLITLPVTIKDQKINIEFYVVETKSMSVIGAATCKRIGLIKRIFCIETTYSDLYQGLGCLPGTHTIKIDKTVLPKVHPPTESANRFKKQS